MFLKTFKFLRVSDNFSVMIKTLKVAASDVSFFILIVVIVNVAFGMAFFKAFGVQLAAFRTPLWSSYTLLLSTIVGFNYYAEVGDLGGTFGEGLSICFLLLLQLVIVNMFIAILGGTHDGATEVANIFCFIH